MRYQVQLGVPRIGGSRAWGAAAGDFQRRLAGQESRTVIAPRADRQIRRGRDFVRVVVVMTVDAGDVAEALGLAWWVFMKAVGDDAGGWDTAAATAEVLPEGLLSASVLQAGASMRKPGQLVTGARSPEECPRLVHAGSKERAGRACHARCRGHPAEPRRVQPDDESRTAPAGPDV